LSSEKILIKGDKKKTWQKYCGFLDLSLREFMQIQEDLLMEEIEMVSESPLGKKIMRNQRPSSVAEFRKMVQLTTYDDYAEFFSERREDVLAEKPCSWVHTSGRSGSFKWIPYTKRAFDKAVDMLVAGFILACAKKKGDINLTGTERCIHNLPPRPYFSGEATFGICQRFDFRITPPLEEAEKMEFQERISEGFKISLRTGLDMIGSMSSILVKIAEGFSEGLQSKKFSLLKLHPLVLLRFLRAIIRSKINKRPLLPRDLWTIKAIVCAGTDTSIYRDLVKYYWGTEPYEYYTGTEQSFPSMQSWTKKGLVFTPYCAFLEFIPESEWLKWRDNEKYQPETVLLDEVKPGENYEIVVTNYYGMPLLRYRVGDLITIDSLEDKEAGLKIPHMSFKSRADGFIDIAGFTRLDEKTIWQAIEDLGIPYVEWSMCKDYIDGKPFLHLFIELKDNDSPERIQDLLHDNLKAIDPFYNDMDTMLELRPLKATLLSKGTFDRYLQEKRAAGYDLAHLKPRHINPTEAMINDLLRLN